ncbi:MAG: hypothetical protein ABL949_14200 [Fimbriimonadaceae bacterium]
MTQAELEKAARRVLETTPWWVIVAVLAVMGAVSLWCNGRMVKRMGYPSYWSLFFLIPCVSTLFWIGLAFSKWPNERRQ